MGSLSNNKTLKIIVKYIVLKKKYDVVIVEPTNVNLKKARLIATNPFNKYTNNAIAEIIERHCIPTNSKINDNENRESV